MIFYKYIIRTGKLRVTQKVTIKKNNFKNVADF